MLDCCHKLHKLNIEYHSVEKSMERKGHSKLLVLSDQISLGSRMAQERIKVIEVRGEEIDSGVAMASEYTDES